MTKMLRWSAAELAAHNAKLAATQDTPANPVVKMAGQCLDAAIKSHRGGNKYGNVPTVVDGIKFPSKREAGRWSHLSLLLKAGQISELERQIRYRIVVQGMHICDYIADFRYRRTSDRMIVVEDSKGVRTPAFRLKSKLMAACHGIEVIEV